MAETNPAEPVAEIPEGPASHDQVAMLSLHPDGSAAQINPEIIGDPEDAKQGLTTQLHQNAVAAHDGEKEPVAVEVAEGYLKEAEAKAEVIVEALKTKVEEVGVAAANEAKAVKASESK